MLDLLTTGTILCTHLGPGTPFEARSRNTTHLSLIDHLLCLFESQQFNLRAATTYSTLLVTPSGLIHELPVLQHQLRPPDATYPAGYHLERRIDAV